MRTEWDHSYKVVSIVPIPCKGYPLLSWLLCLVDLSVCLMRAYWSRDEEGGILVVKELSENIVRICRKEGLQG